MKPEKPKEAVMPSATPSTMAEELRQLRRREPFQPFRVHVKNGETYDVLDALEFGVGGDVFVGLTVHDPNDSDKDYPVSLSMGEVVRIETDRTVADKWPLFITRAGRVIPLICYKGRRIQVRPDAIRKLLRKRPFFPFRVYVSDGATYDVTHPEAGWVSGMILNVHVRPTGLTDGPGQRHANLPDSRYAH